MVHGDPHKVFCIRGCSLVDWSLYLHVKFANIHVNIVCFILEGCIVMWEGSLFLLEWIARIVFILGGLFCVIMLILFWSILDFFQ